ncbi:uncharacterized protein LOC143035015 isoform X4 [Oratosquilla oratoria]|uniref:uncharacterized protein LOC143035015 isoform X4 n=1 Tax=Oratosquilla oratoria TaxID=337810 RepID=UPI003F76DD71
MSTQLSVVVGGQSDASSCCERVVHYGSCRTPNNPTLRNGECMGPGEHTIAKCNSAVW